MDIVKRIEKEIEDKRFEKSQMGTEITTVRMKLSDEERKEFLESDLNENYYYEFEKDESGQEQLTVSYSEV